MNHISGLTRYINDIKVVICDIDGVLTDGKILISEKDWRLKSFDQKDTLGTMIAKYSNLKQIWISLHLTEISKIRGRAIGVDEIIGAKYGKYAAIEEFLLRDGVEYKNVAYIGDDIDDYMVMERCGFPIAVNDSVQDIKTLAKYITNAKGGAGAVRESIELILKTQGKWENAVEKFFEAVRNPLVDPTENFR
ncbi:MAG TPA: HAD hydrolase family protein [bacterium]|nr:HAD hydrolase family protein [bacterium]HPN29842.1 HAD hydrolase family protein [bacterium]